MEDKKLENFEAIMCLIMISIADIVLISSRIIIKQTNSASLLSSLSISIVIVLFTFVLCILSKQFLGKNLLDISEFLGGKFFKKVIGFCFTIYFLFIIGLFLRRMGNALQTIYYPLTNVVFIISLFCIACGIIGSFSATSLFKSMVLLVPFLYWAVVLVFLGNSKNFNYSNIYPILGNGASTTFLFGLTNIFSFVHINQKLTKYI